MKCRCVTSRGKAYYGNACRVNVCNGNACKYNAWNLRKMYV
jgi:hypothetical protein